MKTASATCLAGLLATAAGCADMNYARLRPGQSPQEYDRVLPAERVRRNDAGLCFYESDRFGRSDAIVVLLARDRRVYGKLHATLQTRDLGFREDTTYTLRGEIDAGLGGLKDTGPLDLLRATQADLMHQAGDADATASLHLISAGLQRILQRWPHSGDPAADPAALADVLMRVPGGGRSTLSIDADGLFHLEYVRETSQ